MFGMSQQQLSQMFFQVLSSHLQVEVCFLAVFFEDGDELSHLLMGGLLWGINIAEEVLESAKINMTDKLASLFVEAVAEGRPPDFCSKAIPFAGRLLGLLDLNHYEFVLI